MAGRNRRAYLSHMQKGKFGTLPTIAAVAALLVILGAALWFAASAWLFVGGEPMPTAGYVAMALGIVFSLIIGCGLMALLFYSSRHGYDEPYRADDEQHH
jgi:fatty acid desaturase